MKIEYDRSDNLAGRHYGSVTVIMKRSNPMSPRKNAKLQDLTPNDLKLKT